MQFLVFLSIMAKKHVLCWFILHSFYIWFRVIRENVYICKFAKNGLNFVSLIKWKTLNLCYIVGRRQISRRSSKNSNAGFFNFDDAAFFVFENHFSRTTGVDASLRHGNFKEVLQKADSVFYKTFQRLPFAISPTILQNIPGCWM